MVIRRCGECHQVIDIDAPGAVLNLGYRQRSLVSEVTRDCGQQRGLPAQYLVARGVARGVVGAVGLGPRLDANHRAPSGIGRGDGAHQLTRRSEGGIDADCARTGIDVRVPGMQKRGPSCDHRSGHRYESRPDPVPVIRQQLNIGFETAGCVGGEQR